jgi:mono/diheme cytochrome c family protein
MRRFALAAGAGLLAASAVLATTPQQALLDSYATAAGDSAFSAERGRAFFLAEHASGKPETPSCTTCHTADPRQTGETRAGKPIEPLAVSANPDRLTDPAFVEKWFTRNCASVLGRDCTAAEKGDVIAFLLSF